ncbi:hypothetical protein [Tomitella fengzijianii]|uniref:Uncharacterized protein n=1 Tax=Tomitella fengzijianii TaxID=2597660 RepID=A0A516X0X5_9ACTN|nr:hypothetical protein [Tomitella fengzijianii]QDQ96746.1 hypothetical protein FO059_04535 [Tomitella fengzijianii]
MSGSGRYAGAGDGHPMALDFEAFEEMSRSTLRFYAQELTPGAVSGNSGHWTTAAAGLSGVLDRVHSAVASVADAEFRGAFPDAVRAAHRGFADGAAALGDALGRPAGRLDDAAPQLGDVRTRIAAAPAGGGLLQGFPSRYLFAEPSTELAALMESLYVPAVRQAVAVHPLPGPDVRQRGGADAAGPEGPGAGPDSRPSGIPAAGPAGGVDAGRRGPDVSRPVGASGDGGGGGHVGDVAGDAAAGPGPGPNGGASAPAAQRADTAGVDRYGVSAAEAGGAAPSPVPPGAAGADAAVSGGPHSGPVRGDGSGHTPSALRGTGAGASAGAPVIADGGDRPRARGVGAHGSGLRSPGSAADGRAGGVAGGSAAHGGPLGRVPRSAAGAAATHEAPGGAVRRTMGPAMLGGAGRGRGGDEEGYDAAGFLTTVGNGDQLIGDLGTAVRPVLGSANGS